MISTHTSVQFINHASFKVNFENITLLTDPWYQGDSFHKGWNLLIEQSKDEIVSILKNVTHIWISHEHPDHFSINFFNNYKEIIQNQKIIILFQETRDNRVKNFFLQNKFEFITLKFKKTFVLNQNFKITCIKDGFYDSALFIETKDKKILNLNDCLVNTAERANEILNITGECDILFTQFSYAAWKGGERNLSWRKLAAQEKLDSIFLQVKKFKPSQIVPFASFIYFSNESNKYLNDSVNTPQNVLEKLTNTEVLVNIMKPFDYIEDNELLNKIKQANDFWENKFDNIFKNKFNKYDLVEVTELQKYFKKYQARVFSKNSKIFIKLCRLISPIKIFQPIIIELDDLNTTIVLDILSKSIKTVNLNPDLAMSSESLKFILQFPFGFDTLTVNGCFEEINKNGFSKATKALAIENLNNIGLSFRPSILLSFKTIFLFLQRLKEVNKKI
jgi:UDP-MurNAc hydroxylase